jgi:predicted RecB family endonuclease
MGNRSVLGRLGEHLAVRYLEDRGLVVVARNWRCGGGEVRGEVDIVAWDRRVLVLAGQGELEVAGLASRTARGFTSIKKEP